MNDEESYDSIRDTPLGKCIGATIMDITSTSREDYLTGEEDANRVYFHLSNGETMFATIGEEGSGLMGMLDMEAKED